MQTHHLHGEGGGFEGTVGAVIGSSERDQSRHVTRDPDLLPLDAVT